MPLTKSEVAKIKAWGKEQCLTHLSINWILANFTAKRHTIKRGKK